MPTPLDQFLQSEQGQQWAAAFLRHYPSEGGVAGQSDAFPTPSAESAAISDVRLGPKFRMGDFVRKTKGSQWHGTVVGIYSTSLTLEGYAVESFTEKGSVQIYPANALEPWAP